SRESLNKPGRHTVGDAAMTKGSVWRRSVRLWDTLLHACCEGWKFWHRVLGLGRARAATRQLVPVLELLETRLVPDNGHAFAALKNQAITATLLSFSPADGTSISDYSASILWGDGQQSSANLTEDEGNIQVSGTHTYHWEGHYAGALR